MTETKKRVVAVAFGLLLAGLGLELAVRFADLARGEGFFSGRRNLLAHPKPLVPFLTFGSDLYETRDGQVSIVSREGERFPLHKPAGAIRIVAFGGSTTENRNLIESEGTSYPHLLQGLLRERLGRADLEVINVAFSAYATPHSLILLSLEVLSWDPDIVLLSHNINDLTAAYFPGEPFSYSNKYANEFFGLPNVRSQYSLVNQLFQHSEAYWVVRDRWLRLWDAYDPRHRIRRRSYGDAPPEPARLAFRRNLEEFVTVARSRGIRVVLATQPMYDSVEYFERHMAVKPYNDVVVYPLHREFVLHHRAYNETIRQVARETDALLVDQETRIPQDPDLFVDFVHVNLAGAEKLASGCAEAMIEAGVFSGDPPAPQVEPDRQSRREGP